MIPLQLIIKGLYSYQEKQTIDFTKLTAANLFGIFGPVGSGKSSVIEAITFAVYGRTDRLNLTGDNRYYNMMNLKSDELLIDFIFETGKEQKAYRTIVKGRRNSKNFDDVKALERTAYEKVDTQWLPIENRELERVIGLSYDNFKRTIIIPQGQFQEFLQLGNKDRTQMMKELFNLGKFEFYYKVTSLESKNNALKQNTEGKLQQLGEIDTNQVAQYQEKLDQIKKELEERTLILKSLQQQEEEWKQLKILTEKLKETEKTLNRLREQEPEYRKLEKVVADYENCIIQFKHLFDSLHSSSERLKHKEIQIRQENIELEKKEAEIINTAKQLEVIKPAFEKREEFKQKADELGKLIKIKTLEILIDEKQGRQKKGTQILSQTLDIIEKLKQEKTKLEISVKAEKQKIPDLNVLAQIKAWHVENDSLEKQKKDIEEQLQNYAVAHNSAKLAIQNLLTESAIEELPEHSDLSIVSKFLQEKINTIKNQLKVLDQDADGLRVKVRLQEFAASLQEGEPCPLCGSAHHPVVYNPEDILESQQHFKHLKEIKANEINRINELLSQLNELKNKSDFYESHFKEWTTKKEEFTKKIEVHSALFIWEKYKDLKKLNDAFLEAKQLQSEIEKKEKELEELNKNLDKKYTDKERYQNEIEKINNTLTVSRTELNILQKQLSLIVPELYASKDSAEMEEERNKLLQQYIQLEKQFTEKNNLLSDFRKSADNLTGSINANRKVFLQESETYNKLKEQLNKQLEKTKFQTLDEVRQIISQPIDLQLEKQKLDTFKEHLVLNLKQQEQLLKEIGGRTYDADSHQNLISEITSNHELSKKQNQEFGKLSELLQKLKKDLENQKLLLSELLKIKMREDNIKTMKTLFKASGFINYISSVYLQNLCNAANDRFFQLTRQKLSLEITPDNNFQVRDFTNGGKVRSVKTLSGGQTFQAALSLALALADNIKKITESNQNFFFLDEGFGSLDKESLYVVFDTLKTLRKENRIVGVISHVEEMQQEIDVHLRIENHEEKGSIINPSWMDLMKI